MLSSSNIAPSNKTLTMQDVIDFYTFVSDPNRQSEKSGGSRLRQVSELFVAYIHCLKENRKFAKKQLLLDQIKYLKNFDLLHQEIYKDGDLLQGWVRSDDDSDLISVLENVKNVGNQERHVPYVLITGNHDFDDLCNIKDPAMRAHQMELESKKYLQEQDWTKALNTLEELLNKYSHLDLPLEYIYRTLTICYKMQALNFFKDDDYQALLENLYTTQLLLEKCLQLYNSFPDLFHEHKKKLMDTLNASDGYLLEATQEKISKIFISDDFGDAKKNLLEIFQFLNEWGSQINLGEDKVEKINDLKNNSRMLIFALDWMENAVSHLKAKNFPEALNCYQQAFVPYYEVNTDFMRKIDPENKFINMNKYRTAVAYRIYAEHLECNNNLLQAAHNVFFALQMYEAIPLSNDVKRAINNCHRKRAKLFSQYAASLSPTSRNTARSNYTQAISEIEKISSQTGQDQENLESYKKAKVELTEARNIRWVRLFDHPGSLTPPSPPSPPKKAKTSARKR